MTNNRIFEELKEKIKPILGEKGSHDFSHTIRVYNYAIKISKGLDVDMDIVRASALLHDIARPKERRGEIKDHAEQGVIDSKEMLERLNFPKEKIEIVSKCILLHNKNDQDVANIKEVRVLKEADGLDLTGTMGIARTFSSLGEENNWASEKFLKELTKNLNSEYFKLPIAKKIAEKGVKITKKFCDSFIKEVKLNN
jgi:uncharacterized protein